MKEDYIKSKEGQRRFRNKKTYWLTLKIQSLLWWIGIAWHNTYSDECTKDFNCCAKHFGRRTWLRFSNRK